jgi:flagellar biogenesis protein FliO
MERARILFFFTLPLAALNASADATVASPSPAMPGASLPDAGASVFRVCGAFVVVVALFLGGVWLVRNWQRLTLQRGAAAKLSLIEMKSLGQRQTLYVIGYQQQRMLLASSPAGVTLVSHLPEAPEGEKTVPAASSSFADALQNVLSRKK